MGTIENLEEARTRKSNHQDDARFLKVSKWISRLKRGSFVSVRTTTEDIEGTYEGDMRGLLNVRVGPKLYTIEPSGVISFS